jgi:hypothetical protein
MANTPKKSKQQVPVVFQRMQEQVTAMLAVLHNKIGLEYAIYNEELGINIATAGMKKGKPAKRTRKQTVAFGAYAAVYKPLIETLEKDGYATIPVGGFNVQHMQSAVSAYCSSKWGNGTYTCSAAKDKQSLELWRFPDGFDSSMLKGAPIVAQTTFGPYAHVDD